MSFSRLASLLHEQALWLARADTLGDQWEMSFFAEQEIQAMVGRVLAGPATAEISAMPENERRRRIRDLFVQIVNESRQRRFVNCWTATDGESHAMWSIYAGGAKDGVAIRTSLALLRASLPLDEWPTHLVPVRYSNLDVLTPPDTPLALVSRKLKAFSYEQEWRIVQVHPESIADVLTPPVYGKQMPWNPEQYVQQILVHPAADLATVRAAGCCSTVFVKTR